MALDARMEARFRAIEDDMRALGGLLPPEPEFLRELRTPLTIHSAVTKHFRSALVTVVGFDPVEVDLVLVPGGQAVRLNSSVNHVAFSTIIMEISLARLLYAGAGGPPLIPLDPARFSVPRPLSGWQSFQRYMYVSEGKKCEDVIIHYLEMATADPVPDQLIVLGFAPHQIEGHVVDDDFTYFRSALAGLAAEDPKMVHFRERYPITVMSISRVEVEREMAAAVAESPYARILAILQERVVGQELATTMMASKLAYPVPGSNSVFLEVGPTGIGKTELAKAVASLKAERIVEFHMNQFSEEHSVSSLFGSPAGYAGSTDKPQLAIELERYPAAITHVDDSTIRVKDIVLLFDEIEKAHSIVKQSLLTLFDEGRCILRYTKERRNMNITYHLENCIIISTSNLCQEVVLRAFQAGAPADAIVEAFKAANGALQRARDPRSFSSELIGRVRIIPFGPIPRGAVYQRLLRIKLDSFILAIKAEIHCKDFVVEDSPSFLTIFEERCYGEGVDIRGVKAYMDNIRTLINQYRATWGPIENIKISLYPELAIRRLFMKVETFSPYGVYIPTPGTAPLSLG